jgi:cytochrome o ubiquinol oxidase subunit 3
MSAIGHLVEQPIPLSLQGPAPKRSVAGFGFWLFILSDMAIFAALFATYAVLSGAAAGGPGGAQPFDKGHVLLETACLLASSFTCGMAAVAAERGHRIGIYIWLIATYCLGVAFVGLEVREFLSMIQAGDGPSRSAFLSAFFTLVGAHGLHVTIGLLWLVVMVLQIWTLGLRPMVRRRLFCFALFWHALDIVWIGVFTIVYLGAH